MKKDNQLKTIAYILVVFFLMAIAGFSLGKIGYTEKFVRKMVKAEIRQDYESEIIYRVYFLTIYLVGWYIPPESNNVGEYRGGTNCKVLVVAGIPIFTFAKREWLYR